MARNGEAHLLRMLPKPGPAVVFDVGAHSGEWLRFARALFDNAKFHAFEPIPELFAELASEFAEDTNVHLIQLALGNENVSKERFAVSTASMSTSSFIAEHGADKKVAFIDVEVRTGDTICAENGIETIDFLKIDAEGYDYFVLHGFNRMIREKKIKVIQFENIAILSDNVNIPLSRKKLLIDLIELLGSDYLVGRVLPCGVDFAPYKRIDEFASRNYLAVLRTCEKILARVSTPPAPLI